MRKITQDVIGTASAPKHDLVRSLGADEVLDYRTDDLSGVTGIDVAVATVAGQVPDLAKMLRPEGLLVALNGVDAQAPTDVEGVFLLAEPDRAGLETLAAHGHTRRRRRRRSAITGPCSVNAADCTVAPDSRRIRLNAVVSRTS
ncbi:hypothetical protein KZZ52_47960 [Dactylosporangium sp. AC04546]|uniref:hypothetical protein n=1 Tax=Dactylosporangium sp. AC04546 TaxID=2862460 RepID=UPI001EDFD6CB|nr:hypothetical protein [Dactylosporangium sp. AC04546]WVK81642.1 hypothetical protein KZZ52_47960 [Dactylosporangium sp. AC04546]